MPDNRDQTGRFKKGMSGNPGGRPKVPEQVREMLKAATPRAAALLIACIDDENMPIKDRMDAAKTVLDRVYGKPTQPIDGNVNGAVTVVLEGLADDYAG